MAAALHPAGALVAPAADQRAWRRLAGMATQARHGADIRAAAARAHAARWERAAMAALGPRVTDRETIARYAEQLRAVEMRRIARLSAEARRARRG